MTFSLIICTYMRPKSLLELLDSVEQQLVFPTEILIVDGSTNNETKNVLKENSFKNLKYFKVQNEDRGLTKQRNYGINKVSNKIDIVCFLDDDTELFPNYFKAIINTFQEDDHIIGVGGIAVNEVRWKKKNPRKKYSKKHYYQFDDYVIKESSRNVIRKQFGLQSELPPGVMPKFSNGRTYSYPLNDKIYPVDLLIGMSFNFRKTLFDNIRFSTYFEGYGLYEDADFSLRALNFGKNVINTAAKLNHFHDTSGRPNKFKYGKMVARNGWYVWRVKYPNPNFKAKLKWNLIFLLLMKLRFLNVFTTKNRKEALTESFGRLWGWLSLVFNKPKVER